MLKGDVIFVDIAVRLKGGGSRKIKAELLVVDRIEAKVFDYVPNRLRFLAGGYH